MNLPSVANDVAAILRASPYFTGIPVFVEDGLNDPGEAMGDALETGPGVFFVVQRPVDGSTTVQRRGILCDRCYIPVTITELAPRNRSDDGTGHTPEWLCNKVISLLLGQPQSAPGPDGLFSFMDQPYRFLGHTNGTEAWIINLLATLVTEAER